MWLDTKTYWLTDRQSQCDFDFDSGMVCFAKPILRVDLYTYIVENQEFSVTCYMCDTYTWQRLSIFIREKPILSLERMLRKDYDRKGSVKKKICGRDRGGAWRQDELIDSKSPVIK
jgi:hypothetical protein